MWCYLAWHKLLPWPGLVWLVPTSHKAVLLWLVAIFILAIPAIPALPIVASSGAQLAAPLEWHPSLPNSVHDLNLPIPSQTTSLTLTDAPVIRYSKLEQKYQVFQLSQLVDFTDLSLAGQNLKTQLNRFAGKTTEVFQDFFHDPHSCMSFTSKTTSRFFSAKLSALQRVLP